MVLLLGRLNSTGAGAAFADCCSGLPAGFTFADSVLVERGLLALLLAGFSLVGSYLSALLFLEEPFLTVPELSGVDLSFT